MWSPGKNTIKSQRTQSQMRAMADTGLYTPTDIALEFGTTYHACLKVIKGCAFKRFNSQETIYRGEITNCLHAARARLDDKWEPKVSADFLPTEAPPGTLEKVEVLRKRVEAGQPLWHQHDRIDYSGLTCGNPASNFNFTAASRDGNIKVCPLPGGGKSLA